MSSVKTLAAVLVLSLGAASAARADDGFSYRLSGFGTVGYVATNTNDVMLTNPGQLKGGRKSGSAMPDSRIGGQLDLTFSPTLSASVQGIVKQNVHGRLAPLVQWAFLRYRLKSNLVLRVGRLGFPPYSVSDYRYVGYANPWVRAPIEVYKVAPIDSAEGADLTWSHDVGRGYLTVQALAGHVSTPVVDTTARSGRLKLNQLTGGYITYEIGNLRLRGGMSVSHVTYSTGGSRLLFGGLHDAGLDDVREMFNADNSRTTFSSFGANYDSRRILITGEYARLRSKAKMLGSSSSWHGTFGYRFGKVMPYATWAGYSKKSDIGSYSIPAIDALLPLIGGVDGLAASASQHTSSLGLRIDVYNNVALKLQADHVLPDAAGGLFSGVTSNYHGQAVNVYSVVVDFVF